MADGSIKSDKDIIVGDKVLGIDSKPKTVLDITSNQEDMIYEIKQSNDTYTVNKNHILCLAYDTKKSINANGWLYIVNWIDLYSESESRTFLNKEEATNFYDNIKNIIYIDITVEHYLTLSYNTQNKLMGYRPTNIEFNKIIPDTDPYILGIYLSYLNGELIDNNYLYLLIYLTKQSKINLSDGGIPHLLKINCRNIRLSILAGIIDTIGLYDNVRDIYSIKYLNDKFTNDVKFLCQSLGFVVYIFDNFIILMGNSLHQIPVQHTEKISSPYNKISCKTLHEVISITPKTVSNSINIKVENDKYLQENFIVLQ